MRNHTSLQMRTHAVPSGHSVSSAGDDHAARVRAAPDGVGQRHLRAGDLARAGVAAQLVVRARRPGRAPDAPSGSPFDSRPPLGLTGSAPLISVCAVVDQLGLLAGRAQTELLVREQLARRVGVLALDDVEIVRARCRPLVGVARRELGRAG